MLPLIREISLFGVVHHVIDPLGRPTVTAGSDHCFCSCRPSVRPSPLSKQYIFQTKTMFATGETVSLAEWIIDDTSLVCIFCLIAKMQF